MPVAPPPLIFQKKLTGKCVSTLLDGKTRFYDHEDESDSDHIWFTTLVFPGKEKPLNLCKHKSVEIEQYHFPYEKDGEFFMALVYPPFTSLKKFLSVSGGDGRTVPEWDPYFYVILKEIVEGLVYLYKNNMWMEGLSIDCIGVFRQRGQGQGAVINVPHPTKTHGSEGQNRIKIKHLCDKIKGLCVDRWIELPAPLVSFFECVHSATSEKHIERLTKCPIFIPDQDQLLSLSTYLELSFRYEDYSSLLSEHKVKDSVFLAKMNAADCLVLRAVYKSTKVVYKESRGTKSLCFILRFGRNLAQHYGGQVD